MSSTPSSSVMQVSVATAQRRHHLPGHSWLVRLSGIFGAKVSTVKGWMSGPRSVWVIAQEALRQMVLVGRRDLADERIAELELAFVGSPTEPLPDLLDRKAATSAAETVERTRFLQNRSDDERRRYERELRREVVADQQLLRGLEC